jgi:hypothetical protein
MCKCIPNMRTPYCGVGDCQWPDQSGNSISNIEKPWEYEKGYHDGYKEGLTKGIEILIEKEKRKTEIYFCIKCAESIEISNKKESA